MSAGPCFSPLRNFRTTAASIFRRGQRIAGGATTGLITGHPIKQVDRPLGNQGVDVWD